MTLYLVCVDLNDTLLRSAVNNCWVLSKRGWLSLVRSRAAGLSKMPAQREQLLTCIMLQVDLYGTCGEDPEMLSLSIKIRGRRQVVPCEMQ